MSTFLPIWLMTCWATASRKYRQVSFKRIYNCLVKFEEYLTNLFFKLTLHNRKYYKWSFSNYNLKLVTRPFRSLLSMFCASLWPKYPNGFFKRSKRSLENLQRWCPWFERNSIYPRTPQCRATTMGKKHGADDLNPHIASPDVHINNVERS